MRTDGHKKISTCLHLGESKLQQGYNAGVVLSHEGVDYGTDSTGSSVVLGGFSGMVAGPLTVGAEYNMNVRSLVSEQTSTIISTYGRLEITEQLDTFVRIDIYDVDTSVKGDSEIYLLTGAVYVAETGLSIAPNLRIIKPETSDPTFIYYVNFQFKF